MRRIFLTFFLVACFALPANSALFGADSDPKCTFAAGASQLSIAGSVLRTCGAMVQGSLASAIDAAGPADCSNVPSAAGGGASVLLLQWDDSQGAAGEWACVASEAVSGETNVLGSPDLGAEVDLINSVPKTGSALNLVSLEADHFSVVSDIIRLAIAGGVELTFGTESLQHNGQDFVFSDAIKVLDTNPTLILMSSGLGARGQILMTEQAGPDSLMNLQVEADGVKSTYIQIRGDEELISMIKLLQILNAVPTLVFWDLDNDSTARMFGTEGSASGAILTIQADNSGGTPTTLMTLNGETGIVDLTGDLTLSGPGKAVATVPSATAGSSLVLPEATDNGSSAFTLSVPADLTASKNCQVTASGLLPTNCLQHALQECFVVYRPVDEVQNTDDIDSFWRASAALTLTEVWCETDTGTVNMDLAIDDGSRADVMGTDLVCASTAVSDSSGLAGNMAAGDRLDLLIASVATNPTRLSVCVGYDYD